MHPFPRFQFIQTIINMGGEVYLVGGTVRDIFLKIPHKDYDLLVRNIEAQTLLKSLRPLGPVNMVGKSFGILKFRPHEAADFEFDIALPRLEKSTGAGHRDFEVDYDHTLSVKEDLSRRDFTINAMALNLQSQELTDPFHGEKDLGRKVIRQVFKKAFEEDPLRLMRAVQFAARFSFQIEPETFADMKKQAPLINTVSKERILLETRKMLLAPRPSVGMELMRETGLMDYIFPFARKMIGVLQPMKRNEDVFTHTLKVVDAAKSAREMEHAGDMEVMFASLFHDVGKPHTVGYDEKKKRTTFYGHQNVSKKIARRWLADYKATTIGLDVDQVLSLVENHMFETKSFFTDRAIRRFISKVGKETIFKLIDLRIADKKGGRYPESMKGILKLRDRIRSEINKKVPFGPRDLAVNGHDIMSLGYKPGPLFGKIQHFLVEKVLDEPELNIKEKLLELIKGNF